MGINVTDLRQFTGTEKWHRWSPLFPKVLLTDGAKYVADNAGKHGAYWLMDAIASYQHGEAIAKNKELQQFQLWTLEVTPDKRAKLTCRADSDLPADIEQIIDYTDFDLTEFSMYCLPTGDGQTRTILLQSEY
jgi:hypothetical protein